METKRVRAMTVVELHWSLEEAPRLQGGTQYFAEIQAERVPYLRTIEAMIQVSPLTNVEALFNQTSFMGTVSPERADGNGGMDNVQPDLASFDARDLGPELYREVVEELRKVAREAQASLTP